MDWYVERFDDNWNRDADGLNFRCHSNVEMGKASLVIDRLWMRFDVARGYATYQVFAGKSGHQSPGWTSDKLDTTKNNDWIEFTDTNNRVVSIEGRLSVADACPVPNWIPLAH